MKALILNSGMGSRMGVLTSEHPKCMTEVSGQDTILSRQLRQIADAGIGEVVMTTGLFDSVLVNYCRSLELPLHYTFIKNPFYYYNPSSKFIQTFCDISFVFNMHFATFLFIVITIIIPDYLDSKDGLLLFFTLSKSGLLYHNFQADEEKYSSNSPLSFFHSFLYMKESLDTSLLNTADSNKTYS